MVARPLVGWAFSSSRPAKIGWASDLDANGAGSLTLWLIQSFSGRKANQATMRIGRPIAIQIPFRPKNPISFSICLCKFDSRLASEPYFRACRAEPAPGQRPRRRTANCAFAPRDELYSAPDPRPVGRRIPKYRPLLGRDPSRDGFKAEEPGRPVHERVRDHQSNGVGPEHGAPNA